MICLVVTVQVVSTHAPGLYKTEIRLLQRAHIGRSSPFKNYNFTFFFNWKHITLSKPSMWIILWHPKWSHQIYNVDSLNIWRAFGNQIDLHRSCVLNLADFAFWRLVVGENFKMLFCLLHSYFSKFMKIVDLRIR